MNLDKYINRIKNKHIRTIIIGANQVCIMTFLVFACLCIFMFTLFLGVFIVHVVPYMLDRLISEGIVMKIFGTFVILIILSYVVGKCVEFFNKES